MWPGGKRRADRCKGRPRSVARSRGGSSVPIVAAIMLFVPAEICVAQKASAPPATPPTPSNPRSDGDSTIETYLGSRELRPLLAEHLAARLKGATPEERAAIGERLGKLYLALITSSTGETERKQWEDRAREMLKMVPESQSIELRIDLARTVYVKAEDTAERWRLRLAGDDERAEAERTLKGLKAQLELVAGEAQRRAEQLEKQEEGGRSTDKLAEELAEAKRLRAVAFYYAGWTNYYLAFVSNTAEPFAQDAQKQFGWILGSPGKPPPADKAPKALLRYDHIARAAIGNALAAGLRHNDSEALRWLDAVEDEPETPKVVKATLLGRKISVLAGGRRWADLERAVRIARGSGNGALQPAIARLLAVTCFEADRSLAPDLIEALGQTAMQDLVARGQVGYILDLAQRYGTTPLGEKGFIVFYVRGVQQYDRAVTAQKQAGENIDEPAKAPELVNLYRDAARALGAAFTQDDVRSFPAEYARALVMCGRALFKAGDSEAAAQRFIEASKNVSDPKVAEEALWLAIVSVDRAIRNGATNLDERYDELAVLYLRQYPGTDHAASLLLARASRGGLPDEEAIKVLLGVARDAPSYEQARREAARLLYRSFRGAQEQDKAFASSRFVKVAEEVLGIDRKAAMDAKKETGKPAVDRVIAMCRQLLDALLSTPTPDVQRAEAVLGTLQGVLTYHGAIVGEHEQEFMYRRLQMTLARDDEPGAAQIAEKLRQSESGKRFADSAERLLYQRSLAALAKLLGEKEVKDEAFVAASRKVVLHGRRVIDQLGGTASVLSSPAVITLHRTVAKSAMDIWRVTGEVEMKDLAVKLDRTVLTVAPGATDSLQRLAEIYEKGGEIDAAMDCWKRLGAGIDVDKPEWFQARYETARLLAIRDASKAAVLLAQHAVLYPDYGPEPWGSKLKALHDQVKPMMPKVEKPASGGGPP